MNQENVLCVATFMKIKFQVIIFICSNFISNPSFHHLHESFVVYGNFFSLLSGKENNKILTILHRFFFSGNKAVFSDSLLNKRRQTSLSEPSGISALALRMYFCSRKMGEIVSSIPACNFSMF